MSDRAGGATAWRSTLQLQLQPHRSIVSRGLRQASFKDVGIYLDVLPEWIVPVGCNVRGSLTLFRA